MSVTCKIGQTYYTMIEDMFDLTETVDERQRFQCDIMDYVGQTHFVKGEQVVITDPIMGVMFDGVINTVKEIIQYPNNSIIHSIDCIDKGQYYASKRTFTGEYLSPQPAGKLVIDQLSQVLSQEDIQQNYSEVFDNTVSDFSQGFLNGVEGAIDNLTGRDVLQLGKAGSDLIINEPTTNPFTTGTLSNMQVVDDILYPTTTSAIRASAYLPFSLFGSYLDLDFYTTQFVIPPDLPATATTGDVGYYYDIFIPSTSPEIKITVNMKFTDGTFLAATNDTNGLAVDPQTDLAQYAKDQWYHRLINLSGYTGKTVKSCYIGFGGAAGGTYTCFIKNIFVSNGQGAGSTTQVILPIYFYQPPLVPLVVQNYLYYVPAIVTGNAVQVYDPLTSVRTSVAYPITNVEIISTSVTTWIAELPNNTKFILRASYDNGATFHDCQQSTALTILPNGSNVSGLSIILQESFDGGTDPSVIPSVSNVTVAITSAARATKTDVTASFTKKADFDAGIYTGTAFAYPDLSNTGRDFLSCGKPLPAALGNPGHPLIPATPGTAGTAGTPFIKGTPAVPAGNPIPSPINRNWSDRLITNQTLFINSNTISQSAASGTYTVTFSQLSTTANYTFESRLDFAGILTDMDISVDIAINPSFNQSIQAYVSYRATVFNTGALGYNGGYYMVLSTQNPPIIALWAAVSPGGAADRLLGQATGAVSNIRMLISGNSHKIYLNGSSIPAISAIDSHTLTAGYVALGGEQFHQNPTGTPVFGTIQFNNMVTPLTTPGTPYIPAGPDTPATAGTPGTPGTAEIPAVPPSGPAPPNPPVFGNWLSPYISIGNANTVDGSVISWFEANTDKTIDSSISVTSSVDNGQTYQNCISGQPIPNLPPGTSATNKTVRLQIILASASPTLAPFVNQIQWRVLGHYTGATGTRTTVPTGYDTNIVRETLSGWGTAADGQAWLQNGLTNSMVHNGTARMANTTGNAVMILGTRTMGDSEITGRVSIATSFLTTAQSAGLTLRYVNAFNYYIFSFTTSNLTITKVYNGISYILESIPMTFMINTSYRIRFRAIGTGPVYLYGKIWADGTLEPGLKNGVISIINPAWTMIAVD